MSDAEEGGSRIKVTDRRAFGRGGERHSEPETAAVEPAAATAEPAAATAPATDPAAGASPDASLDFVAFLQSLYVGALMSLGDVENPYTRQYETNLDLARQNIDILMMLAEKTRGNLDPEEQGLLDQVLPQLQLRYVQKSK